jgi:hypothetical protein
MSNVSSNPIILYISHLCSVDSRSTAWEPFGNSCPWSLKNKQTAFAQFVPPTCDGSNVIGDEGELDDAVGNALHL